MIRFLVRVGCPLRCESLEPISVLQISRSCSGRRAHRQMNGTTEGQNDAIETQHAQVVSEAGRIDVRQASWRLTALRAVAGG
eukprot:2741691-Pleurochrysis_carterae.AAC.2